MSGTTRTVVAALIRHARKVMPPVEAAWGAAMEREAAHIEGDGAMLQWAMGCVAASYGERLRAEHYLLPLLARCYLACICAALAVGHLAGPPWSQLLCRLTGQAQPIYPPFPFVIPFASLAFPPQIHGPSCYFLPAAPLLVSALVLTKAALNLLTAWWLVRGRAAALTAFVLAGLLGTIPVLDWVMRTILPASVMMQAPWNSLMHWDVLSSVQARQMLLYILFGLLYPLIIGTCIALLVRRDDRAPSPKPE
jgi:hypothetical protein